MADVSPYPLFARALSLLAPFQPDPRKALFGPEGGHTVQRFAVDRGRFPIPAVHFKPVVGTGETVVYVHGGGTADILISAPLFEGLLRRGVGVVAFDMDGFGENGVPLVYPDCLDVLPLVLEAVRELEGVDRDRIGLYGLSLGAAFGMHAAAEAPWLKAMVLFGTPLGLVLSEWDRFREFFGTMHPMSAPVLLDAPVGHVARTFFKPVRFEDAALTLFEDEFARRLDTLLRTLDPLLVARSVPAIPVLLQQGEWDAVVPPAHVQQRAEQLPGPVEVQRFKNRNHTTLLYDREAAEAAAKWLTEKL
jgi:pimeloyl-ACP methyl ester carboxylesterase